MQYALQAAARGLPVILVRISADGKFPAVPSAHPKGDPQRGRCRGECGRLGHGIHDASLDEDRIAEMAQASRYFNGYAIGCGQPPHHVLGLDLDTKNGQDGIALLSAFSDMHGFEVPDTITVDTPSGGRHVYLSAPPGARIANAVGRVGTLNAPGIDIRFFGGQLVGPGSRGPAGTYRLASRPDARIAACPKRLLDLLSTVPRRRPEPRADRGPRQITKRIEGLIATVLGAQPGGRNGALFWAAARMSEAVRDGSLAEYEGRELLLAAADRIGLDFAEADRTISSAFGRA